MTVPLLVLSTIDPVLRDTAVFSTLSDLPGTAVLRQDLDPDSGVLHRMITDHTGVVEDESVFLAHTCLGCAVREDALPTLQRMAASGRWQRIVLLSPVSAESTPAARPLADPETAARHGIELRATVTVVDSSAVVADLMGDDLLSERELALGRDDHRSVGEALAGQVGHADLVLTLGDHATGLTLVDHLRGAGSARFDLYDADTADLFAPRHHRLVAESRLDPRLVLPPEAADGHGVWSIDLQTRRPVHPGRFHQLVEQLGGGRLRSRGRFLLPTRPDMVGVWDGAGGQVSIGDAGAWGHARPSTRIVFTGIDDDRARVADTFARMLMTDQEIARGRRFWTAQRDDLDEWLGGREDAA